MVLFHIACYFKQMNSVTAMGSSSQLLKVCFVNFEKVIPLDLSLWIGALKFLLASYACGKCDVHQTLVLT